MSKRIRLSLAPHQISQVLMALDTELQDLSTPEHTKGVRAVRRLIVNQWRRQAYRPIKAEGESK